MLKNLRKQKKLSQRDLAKLLKIAPSTLAMYETGKRAPDYQTLMTIADFFQVSVDLLLGRNIYHICESAAGYSTGETEIPSGWKRVAVFIRRADMILNDEDREDLLELMETFVKRVELRKKRDKVEPTQKTSEEGAGYRPPTG